MHSPRDLSLRVFHRLGSNQLIVSLQINEGEDAYTRVVQTFRKAQLPSCFFRPTLEYVALAIRESLADANQAAIGGTGRPGGLAFGLAEAFEERAPSPFGADVRQLQLKGFIPPDEHSWGLQFFSHQSATFWCAYDFLLRHRPSFFRTIGTLEDSYLWAIRELFQGRAVAVSELQRCQAMEMERLRQSEEEAVGCEEAVGPVGGDVQVLVGQHVSEIDALERHWQSEIEQLKAKQEASYQDLVVDFFEQEMLEAKEMNPLQCPEQEGDYLACPLHPAAWKERVHPPWDSSATVQTKVTKISEVRATFGGVSGGPSARTSFFILRLWVGDVMELSEAPEMVATGDAVPDADGAGPQLPRDFLGLESYRCDSYMSTFGTWQNQQPILGSAKPRAPRPGPEVGREVSQSASLRFWREPNIPCLPLSPNAYASRLRGLIIPTPENLQFDTIQVSMLRDLDARGQKVTDVHFPSLKKQFEAIKQKEEWCSAGFRAGSYFCTRHSNLGGRLQVVFHLLVPSDAHSADELPASLHRALQRIFADCDRCHVAEVTLPLLLLDTGTSDTSLPFASAQRRAEQSLKALKSALTQVAETAEGTREPGASVVNLVLPVSALQSVGKTPSVAHLTQSFLENSFQCV
ncbi:unnamed protein product [Durusdinium trenchii]|uniref:Uncharacterized protein n=2 Tax=Durusdinium trenchii TaxID=1381693 RepID=A0ABP0QKZ1_9DINO